MHVLFPTSIDEACAMMARERDDAGRPPVPIAGGTDVMVFWPVRVEARERVYLDLSGLAELRPMRWTEGALELGALTTYWDVIRDARACDEFPLLVAAARTVGAIQIQSRGTWAGNIANGSPAADGVPALMACDATVVLASQAGMREVALTDFYTGYRATVMKEGELIAAVRVPSRPRDFGAFEKVGPRRAQAITKVGAAITRLADGSPEPWRVVANSAAPTVRRCREVERMLNEGAPVRSPADFLPALRRDISPIDDLRSTARYRMEVLARVLYHRLRGACATVV